MLIAKVASKIADRCIREFRLLLWNFNRRFKKSVTILTKQGKFTISYQDNFISKSLFCRREYELDLMLKTTALIQGFEQSRPKGEGTVLDIGANMGIISVGMIHKGLVKKAVAIEPEPQNFFLLQHNIRQNGLEDKVLCLPFAASDKSGKIQFEISDANFGDHRVRSNLFANNSPELYQESSRRIIEVESNQLDRIIEKLPESFIKEISIIWIDVQGYEGYVFLGGKHLLAKGIPVIAEIWPYGMKRAGMDGKQFCEIAKDIWSGYWVMQKGEFVKYPISALSTLFDELGYDGGHSNVIFTQ